MKISRACSSLSVSGFCSVLPSVFSVAWLGEKGNVAELVGDGATLQTWNERVSRRKGSEIHLLMNESAS